MCKDDEEECDLMNNWLRKKNENHEYTEYNYYYLSVHVFLLDLTGKTCSQQREWRG